VAHRLLAACAALFTLTLTLHAGTAVADESTPNVTTSRQTSSLNPDLTLTGLDEKTAFELSQAAIGKEVGDFVLLDRNGKPVELRQFRGKPLLVNFLYTACFQVCPTTTRNLQKAIAETVSVMGADRFNIVSIGFNQPFDSPQAMKDFATRYGVSLPNWKFLSPAQAIVGDVTKNFGFSFVANAAGFDHLNQITMVDASGKIVRQVYGEKFTAPDLAEPLKQLIAGSTIPSGTNPVAELMQRVRILCSVYDPVTGRYRTDYSLYFMAAGFITFLGFMIYLSINVWKSTRRSTP